MAVQGPRWVLCKRLCIRELNLKMSFTFKPVQYKYFVNALQDPCYCSK